MTARIQIPREIDRVHVRPKHGVDPKSGKYGRLRGVVEMDGRDSTAGGRFVEGKTLFAETSAAHASRLLKAEGFEQVGRISPFDGGRDWERSRGNPRAKRKPTGYRKAFFILGQYLGRSPEVIDHFDTMAEADRAVDEYRSAYGEGWKIWLERNEGATANRNPIDAFALRHLATWIDATIAADERDTARDVILEQLARDPDATDRGWSWREIYDVGLRNRNRGTLDTSAARFAKPEPRKRAKRNAGSVATKSDLLYVERALFKAWNAERRGDAEEIATTRKNADRAVARFVKRYGEAVTRAEGFLTPVRWTGNPSPRANAEAIPAHLALLGEVLEVTIQNHARRKRFGFPKGALLLASGDGRTIVLARPSNAKRAPLPRGKASAAARKMFEKWSSFKTLTAVKIEVSDRPLSVDLGAPQVIRYRSSKWTGKPTLYEHVFTGKTTAIADAASVPELIRIDGDPPRVIVTDRGIIG
jgi:hypothetical protein